MTSVRSIPTLSLLSILGLACSSTDPEATASQSGTDVTTPGSASATEDSNTDDGEPTDSGSNPTTSSGSAGNTDGGTTSDPTAATEIAEAGETDTATTGPDPSTTTEPDTSTTEPDPSTTEPDPSTDTGDDTTDTGDDTTDTGDADCQAPATQPPCDAGTSDIFKAIGLNCSDDKSTAIPIKNPVIAAPAANSYRVATHFGSAKDPMDANLYQWGPKEGERLLAITTGQFVALQNDGALIEPDSSVSDANGNPDNLQDLPGIMTWEQGSNGGNGGTPFMNCDGVQDCSDTLDPQWNISPNNTANDVFYMSFDLEVPVGTHGYLLDFAYFSEEWPNYVGDTFNDMFVVWSTSESFTGNVTFINDQPLTVTALDPFMAIKPGDPLLVGTGFPDFADGFFGSGAGTGWFTAKGSAVPGESFTVAISVFDMGDTILDTIGLVDKFRWDCTGCVPSEVDSCGIEPQ